MRDRQLLSKKKKRKMGVQMEIRDNCREERDQRETKDRDGLKTSAKGKKIGDIVKWKMSLWTNGV